jgi:hypothetical protein
MLAQLIVAMFKNNNQHVALELKSHEDTPHEPPAPMKTPSDLGEIFEGSVLPIITQMNTQLPLFQ